MHLTRLAREHGDKPAVIMADSGVTLSYAELDRQSNKIAQLFRSRGLRPGDHIAVLMENRPERMIGWLGPILTEFYAGSEGNGFCMIDSPTWLRHKGSVGKPILGEVHICSDDGDELPPGQTGTVWFSGTRRFSYQNDHAKTAGVFNDQGWSTLGDMGYLDGEGYLYLADRRTDLILSGGVNIYPREIEDALALHPAVGDIVVFGMPDEDMGQRVHAVLQPAVPGAGTPELADELIAFCRARIAHYKAPRAISFEDELPRLPSGKMLRRLLMERYRSLPSS